METNVYIFCYKIGNELEDMIVYTDKEKALNMLSERKKSHQVLEYVMYGGMCENGPTAAYYYNDEAVLTKVVF